MIVIDCRWRTLPFWLWAFACDAAQEIAKSARSFATRNPGAVAALWLGLELAASIAFAGVFLLALAGWLGGH